MGRLTKKQKKKIHYLLRSKTELEQKQKLLHQDGVPKFIEKHLPYIRKLARNLDQLLIVGSFVSPPLKLGLIDRFLVLAEIENIDPLICFNKVDLLSDARQGEEVREIYSRIGYRALLTSAKTGVGIGELAKALKGKRTALAGHSGVGKSSLLNAIDPNLQIMVNDVSHVTRKGRHTTTRVKVYHFDDQTEVIDLPGIKLIDFIDIHYQDARLYFREFEQYAPHCRFNDCLHITEHDCAVKEALKKGEIHPERYRSYLAFVDSLKL
ncbi:MAG TPA: ribosome small subunit-dependent GTPase A [Caldithrix abyssi]|uniref:Small ribosomal subunit biogenesis GTPase RsgA n=1 Tax=Caldithrix abyssi TaxID=187145 RepID=A0A7V5PMU6_CALAY|nr:ribosome small subunit-dependent GTPase A [Caldithrix abyssi]